MSAVVGFLFDENLRGEPFEAVEYLNAAAGFPLRLDVVGSATCVPRGSSDQAVLQWAAAEGHILVTLDVASMPMHLRQMVAVGIEIPGILCISPSVRPIPFRWLFDYLVLIATCSDGTEWVNRIAYLSP